MRVIGLTGGIASGKSTVAEGLKEMGAVIIDGDRLSRELTAPGGIALTDLRVSFGDGVFQPDGTLNRRLLGQIVFGDPEQLRKLDAIMQPRLREMIQRRLEEARAAQTPAVVLDMPLLYEKELDSLCDVVFCTYLPRAMQLARLMARDGFSRDEAEARLQSQMDPAEKARRADVVIDTSGSIEETRALLPGLYHAALTPEEVP